MIDIDTNALCGEHRFKSATQWCFCVFLPRKTTCYILFNQTRRCHSTSFWLRGDTVSVLPTSICIGFTQRRCTKSAAQDFQAAPRWCCSFSSAAPMPGTSFSQYFLKASLMSSPLTFFITGALPFEFLLYFHILYLRHMPLEPMGFNTLIAHSKSHALKMDFAHSLQPSTSLLVLSALFNPSGHLVSSLGPGTSGSETCLVNHVVPVQIFMQSISVCFNGHSFNVMLQTLCLQLAMCPLGLAAFAIKQVATRRGEMRWTRSSPAEAYQTSTLPGWHLALGILILQHSGPCDHMSGTMFYSWFLQQVSSSLPKPGFLHCRAFLCCLLRCWISLLEGL